MDEKQRINADSTDTKKFDEDTHFMQEVIELAARGEGYTSPNPLVGAMVVKKGEVIGRGYHKYYGGPHAEVYALEEAGEKAEGAALYVNLEPCSHFGKTPPCSQKVIKSGIKRVVIAMEDPNPVAGGGIKQLENAGIEVKTGVLEKEARELNEVFIKYMTSEFPFIYLKTAQTIDGYLATSTGDSSWITNKKAREVGHKLRHKVDAILVGIGTILKDDPLLTTRLPVGEGRDSIRIILDARLQIPLDARIINQEATAPTIIVAGENSNSAEKEQLSRMDQVEVLSMPLNEEGRIPLRDLMRILHDRKISSILVEGGGRVNHSFINKGFIDRLYCFISPKILGGNDGVAVYSGPGPLKIEDVKIMTEMEYKLLDDNILLTGKIKGAE